MNNFFLLFYVCIHIGFSSTTQDNEPLSLMRGPDGYRFPSEYRSQDESFLQFLCPLEMNAGYQINEYNLGPKLNEGPFCEKPVKALLKKSEQLSVSCGIDGKSVYYDFIFRSEKFQELLIYRICYDRRNNKTIYTYYPMISPAVLKSESLTTESQKTFKMDTDNYNSLLKENDMKYLHDEYKQYHFPGLKTLSFSKLKPLLLVSPEDMAILVLKKPTYHYINSVPAWTNVIEMWDVINDYLRTIAINISNKFGYFEDETTMIQMSGSMGHLVLNEREIYLDKSKKIAVPEFIWKLAYIRAEQKILAILLRNIPNANKENKFEDTRCKDENYDQKIEELKKLRPKIEWKNFILFCDPSVITDLFQIPENLGFLLQKEYLLPLVLTYNPELDEYQLPQTYIKPEEWKMNAGMKTTQFLFCPIQDKSKQKKENQCLVFNLNNDPYCKNPLEAFNKQSESSKINCNDNKRFYLYDRIYEMCSNYEKIEFQKENEEEVSATSIKPEKQVVHSFCMDNQREPITLFTYHVIRSPELLMNKDLKKGLEIGYESNCYSAAKIPHRVMFQTVFYPYAIRESYNLHISSYRFGQLYMVPPEDMAFPVFRKATYHTDNMTHAWENIITVYNIIHERLRLHAIHKDQELIEINGVKDVLELRGKTITKGHFLLPKYIWTIAYNPNQTKNIAIVIHNIPHEDYSGEVEKLCESSMCHIQEWDLTMTTDLATFAYCCDADVITNIHNFPKAEGKLEIEALFWPLVVIYYEYEYEFPESFNGLNEPADDIDHHQINFCPDEYDNPKKFNEFCLFPNKTAIPYCTKPVKYVWIKNKLSNSCYGRDMIDFSVVFQLCSEEETKIKNLEVYRVCYNKQKKRTIFTYHQTISPALMNNKNLVGQRRKKFSWDKNDYLLLNNDFETLENAFEKKKSGIFEEIADKQSLQRLMLTSPYQMPFASLIESTYHYVNVIPVWEEIVHIWNAIDKHISTIALKKQQKFIHINGSSEEILQTLDGEKIYLDDDKLIPMSKYIWKVVYVQDMTQNVAIIINNSPHDKILTPGKLCELNDLCSFLWKSETFIHGFVTGIAYCCQGDVITDKYSLPKSWSSLKVGEIQYQYPSKPTDEN